MTKVAASAAVIRLSIAQATVQHALELGELDTLRDAFASWNLAVSDALAATR